MRKDAKIGFAIGGVLLAVIVVYVVISSNHRNAISPKGVTLVTPAGGSDQSVTPTVPNSENPAASASNAEPANPKSDDKVASGDGVDWGKLLSGNNPPLMSATPTPASSFATPTASAITSSAAPSATTGMPVATDVPVALPAMSAATPTTLPSAGGRTYTVKPGQTLSSIAAEVYGNSRFYVAIMRANPSINPNRLRAGTKITLPDISDVKPDATAKTETTSRTAVESANTYKVQSGDNLYRIAKNLFGSPKQADAIYALNKELIGPDKTRLHVGMVLKLPTAPTVVATASRE